MGNRIDSTTVEVPTVLRDRLARRRVHPRQAMHEIIEDALDVLDDLESVARPSIASSNPS
jgi:hypothetical protein